MRDSPENQVIQEGASLSRKQFFSQWQDIKENFGAGSEVS